MFDYSKKSTHIFSHFEVMAFTAGLESFSHEVIRALDPSSEVFTFCLYRDACYIKDARYVKNLNVLGRDLAKTIIVDNSLEAFGFHPDNGILVSSWFGDQKDDLELLKLREFLKELLNRPSGDVRDFLTEKFHLKSKIFQP